ncbi:asparagine synthase (glutamine-hydrolyzing) [Arhodomonas aquaeolei]|uniref:asparagine synthase (glutamine-hydrolyzing) n=1 Tax=Arhodomonas aquaeolei TaxID=2369 RepID=UPI00036BD6FD|nr:asparagine synthase (glutamine-hydrolyzing) [Arhodomonas aquaeolei]
MCGLCGILRLTASAPPVEAEVLAGMIARIGHRGPDEQRLRIEPEIGLGHARLSIIDLATGSQPIHNEDRRIWVVFNGEVFNYPELRRALQAQGHRFYTDTDTEVLVHLYEEYGDDFVEHLNGQFAIALWDGRHRRLVLVRDRVGIAPLYYAERDGRLLFASEVKALLPALGEAPRMDPAGLDQLLTFWAPVAPRTLFAGISELPPGEMLIAEGGRCRRRRYWQWQYPEHPDGYLRDTPESLAESLHDLLADAVRVRLRADVPVGAYLSGGLDSAVITALIHRRADVPLRTFSLRFTDPGLDESAFQRAMVEHLRAAHTAVPVTDELVANGLPAAVWHAEMPMLRAAPVPMAALSAAVRGAGYRVVLTGEGADEVLGGYDLFKEAKIRAFWARQPDSRLRPRLLRRLYPYLDMTRGQGQVYLERFFGMGLDDPSGAFFSHLPRWTTTARTKQFLSPAYAGAAVDGALAGLAEALPAGMRRWQGLERAQYLEARTLMAGYLLSAQGDRMLMANGVEGRFPYLDHRVIEFANRLEPRLKLRVLREKHLLREAMAGYLPAALTHRHKQPYRAPDAAAFFRGTTPAFVDELLAPGKLADYGYFDPSRVSRLLAKARRGGITGFADNMAFMAVLSTQLWHRQFVEDYHRQFVRLRPEGLRQAVTIEAEA